MDLQETDSLEPAQEAQISTEVTPRRMRIFLDYYAKTGHLARSCEAAGIHHKTHYRKLKSDPAYREAFEECIHQAGQLLEDRAFELALEGDTHILLPMLRRFRPEYRERAAMEVNGSIDLVDKLAQARERMIPLDADTDSNPS